MEHKTFLAFPFGPIPTRVKEWCEACGTFTQHYLEFNHLDFREKYIYVDAFCGCCDSKVGEKMTIFRLRTPIKEWNKKQLAFRHAEN